MSALATFRSRPVNLGALIDENERLKRLVRQLEMRLATAETEAEAWRQRRGAASTRRPGPHLHLSEGLLAMAALLAREDIVSCERLAAAFQAASPLARGGATIRNVIADLRLKLRPYGVKIENFHGRGYGVAREQRAALKEAMGGEG